LFSCWIGIVLESNSDHNRRTTLNHLTSIRPYWETVFGLAQDGKVGRNGLPNLLQLAVVAPYADSYDPKAPVAVTKALVAVLGRIGRLLGYKARYAKYSA